MQLNGPGGRSSVRGEQPVRAAYLPGTSLAARERVLQRREIDEVRHILTNVADRPAPGPTGYPARLSFAVTSSPAQMRLIRPRAVEAKDRWLSLRATPDELTPGPCATVEPTQPSRCSPAPSMPRFPILCADFGQCAVVVLDKDDLDDAALLLACAWAR